MPLQIPEITIDVPEIPLVEPPPGMPRAFADWTQEHYRQMVFWRERLINSLSEFASKVQDLERSIDGLRSTVNDHETRLRNLEGP